MGSVPVRVELVSESGHTRVERLRLPDGGSVIRKEPLGPGREDRLAHESGILRRLSGVAEVAQLAGLQPDDGSILLEDVGSAPLSGVATPAETSWLINLMLALARAVAGVHERGVIHGDINPSNVLVDECGRSVCLIDFALAVTFAELGPEFTHPREIAGTLPYLAPEQTGRTGRAVDRRSDLYALGATMYELATGRPPFGTGDPVRLIHDHLARAPVPPAKVNPAVPFAVSEIVMHLLEKEPDSRYQTAEGLIRDLKRVRDGDLQLQIGADDVPSHLNEPSQLVGREREFEMLRAAFEGALSGQSKAVAVSGGSGVGKSALIGELRAIASAADGWFAMGKFDRHRRDLEHDAVHQALRGLGRLLLAEPEEQLAEIRPRLLRALGSNAGMAMAVLPEFADLLKVRPDRGDPLTAQERAYQTAVEILRAVASKKRPVVFAVDDAQWAGATPLSLIDHLLSGEERIEGLLTVAAYRDDHVSEADPVAPLLAAWQSQSGEPVQLRITNLDQDKLAALIAEMLRCAHERATQLAGAIFKLTDGNPYATIQLLNGLRRDGVLQPTTSGWSWDAVTLGQRLARENIGELAKARVDAMPPQTQDVLKAMACLGGEVGLHVLAVATDLPTPTLEQRLAPALDDGLLVTVAVRQGARFRHDQLRDAVLSGLSATELEALRLRLARQLATRPELFAVAAAQYLPVIEDVFDPAERRHTAQLLRQAAEQNMWIGESQPAEQMLGAAIKLTDDPATLLGLYTARHTALYRLGRLDDADEVYHTVVEISAGPHDRLEATRVQVSSLTNRNRPTDAITLGLDLLGQLGWTIPTSPQQLAIDIDRGIEWIYSWIDQTTVADDLRRPDVTDPTIVATGALISRMLPACYFRDQTTMAWLALTTARLWAERGPTRTLLGPVSHLPWILIGRRQDYRTGYIVLNRLLTVGEQREYEPDLSEARFLYGMGVCHWFHTLEQAADEGRRAREGLIRGGELQTAGRTYVMTSELDIANTLAECTEEIDSALMLASRTGNEQMMGVFRPFRWLVASLRGEPSSCDEMQAHDVPAEPLAAACVHLTRALAAAVFDDPAALYRHSEAAMTLRRADEASYTDWRIRLVRAIALAEQARSAPEQTGPMADLDEILGWMAQRATDMPTNFAHLVSLVEAERAWALRDFGTAIRAFDRALRHANHRPWHRAFIAERWAKLMLAQGVDYAGWSLLVEARETYRLWGAQAKVDQLDRAFPRLDIPAEQSLGHASRRSSITAGAIDMLGILAASRALSSETTIGALRAKLVEVLSTMTGATDVGLLVWHTDRHRWQAVADHGNGPTSADQHMPESVVRYVQRTREPLIVADATRDDRFRRDTYFTSLDVCSVLAVPIQSRGALQAIVLLENRLIREAFPNERLEGVVLIAGQLAVSLDNALLYQSLEQKVAERTKQLADANQRLAELTITDPLTGLANRRRLEQSLAAEHVRARRTHAPLSLGMVDIDHFKDYNDWHGHRAGDRCLQRVATQLALTVRETDIVARYGGEEFAIIMPNTDPTAARDAAERVRIAVADLGEPLTADEIVTASIGVATLHNPEHQTTDDLIQSADVALYRAKHGGRNRVG
jgi:diguanylate cyclase (GGDEF)-like protein